MPGEPYLASPLFADAPAHPAFADGPGLRLTERRDVGLVLLRGKPENAEFASWFRALAGTALPDERRLVIAGGFEIVRMGRMDYLISGEIGFINAFARQGEAAAEGAPCAVVDITHGRIIVDVDGAGSRAVLSKSCGLDMRLQRFPVGLGTRTRFADLLVYIERRSEQTFRLISDRATGAYLWSWLKDAGKEFLQ